MDKPPGSGPYYVAERIPNRRIVLERNRYYRGGRVANPDRIVWTIEPDRGERLRATEQDANDFLAVFDVPDAVVRSLVGHGVGRHYHEDPHIPNFGEPGRGPRLSEGMTIAIEPMITAGSPEVLLDEDGWTIRTADGSISAHFEHTVAITDEGPRILTPRVGVPGGVEV